MILGSGLLFWATLYTHTFHRQLTASRAYTVAIVCFFCNSHTSFFSCVQKLCLSSVTFHINSCLEPSVHPVGLKPHRRSCFNIRTLKITVKPAKTGTICYKTLDRPISLNLRDLRLPNSVQPDQLNNDRMFLLRDPPPLVPYRFVHAGATSLLCLTEW